MGPHTSSRVPWGPLIYPEGAHGDPHGAPFPRKFFSWLCREFFFPPSRLWGPHGPPPWTAFPGKFFSRLCREIFFPPSRPWGPHGAPDLWSICLIYIEICSFSWKIRFRHRCKWVLWLKYRLYKISRKFIYNLFDFFFDFFKSSGESGGEFWWFFLHHFIIVLDRKIQFY